ncbi:MAG: glycosyltransferase family 4 protein [Peptococcaceae bacterium]
MKIAFFSDSYRPYTSGVVISLDTFKKELTALGHNIYLFVPSYPNYRDNEENIFRFMALPAPTNPDFNIALPLSRRAKSVIRSFQPDIIHVHSPFMLGKLGASYARQLNVPLVFTFHTLYEEYVHYVPLAPYIAKKTTRYFCRNFCNKCDLIIVPTAEIGNYLKWLGVTVPVKKVPTGLNMEDFTQIKANVSWLRKSYDLGAEEKVLLFVGRLGQEKNLPFLLHAYKEVQEEFPVTRLVLVGGGPEEKNLKYLAKQLGITSKLIFTGALPKEKVIECYYAADLFVFASVTETQGLVLPEAKAAGLPIIALSAYGVKEMVADGEDGFLITPKLNKEKETIAEFAAKIKLVLGQDELRKLLCKQAKINAAQYSIHNCALSLEEGYKLAQEIKEAQRHKGT